MFFSRNFSVLHFDTRTFLTEAVDFSLSKTSSRAYLAPCVMGRGLQWLWNESDPTHLNIAGVKNVWSFTSTAIYAFMTRTRTI
jgi:hypothetical protein